MQTKLIVFTDLDGTLLDHDNYSWQEAKPALDRLKLKHGPVIISGFLHWGHWFQSEECRLLIPLQ